MKKRESEMGRGGIKREGKGTEGNIQEREKVEWKGNRRQKQRAGG
jgi:hypothetical protein